MIVVLGVVFFLATCSILFVLFPPVSCFKKGYQIIKHIYTLKTIKKKRV